MTRTCTLLIGAAILVGCTNAPSDTLHDPLTPTVVEKGRYLTHTLAACGFCHGATAVPGAPLTGGRPYYDIYGEVTVPNLVPETGRSVDWTTFDLMRVIRGSRRPDDEVISPTAHRGYEWMSDDDAHAIVSYLRVLPRSGNPTERRSISFLDRNTVGFFAPPAREVRGYIPAITPQYQLEYGAYLVDHVARCVNCHNTPGTFFSSEEYLGGGGIVKTDAGEKAAPGITSDMVTGVGGWSDAQIVAYLRTGVAPDGRQVDQRFCPTAFYARAEDQDLEAIAAHLKRVRR
ncbi:MAG: hypothetical protein QY326_07530 [Bdellovibrionota bacterium]|nr:MAG: hypothetical protein QY326_07530 [Bdellovibrionota bacterium]